MFMSTFSIFLSICQYIFDVYIHLRLLTDRKMHRLHSQISVCTSFTVLQEQ